jgi:hypothetical protein
MHKSDDDRARTPSVPGPTPSSTDLPISQYGGVSEAATPQGLPSSERPEAIVAPAPVSDGDTHLMDRFRTYLAQAREVSARSSRWLLGR